MAVPTTPSNILVRYEGKDFNRVKISWDAVSGATSYKVYKCAIPYGTFEVVGTPTTNYLSYLPPLVLQIDWFFKISSVNADGEGILSNAYSVEDFDPFEPSPLTNEEYYSNDDIEFEIGEVRSRLNAILEFGGESIYLFKRQWSESEEDEDKPGREGNYWDALKIKIKFQPIGEVRWYEVGGISTEVKPRCWTVYYPKLRDRDVLVNRQNERFEITNVTFRRFRGYLIRQEFDINELQTLDDVEKLIIPEPL